MAHQLSIECLSNVFEILNEDLDEEALRSCLLVSRHWCKVSVQILWKFVRNYNTLVACLPKESKETLKNNGIVLPTLKPLLFDYVEFIKCLSIEELDLGIKRILMEHQPNDFDNDKYMLVSQEILKMVMSRSSLKGLSFYHLNSRDIVALPFTTYPGAENCLRDLCALGCGSDLSSDETFYQLSQMCHQVRALGVSFGEVISSRLADLISVQENLNFLRLTKRDGIDLCYESCAEMISSLGKVSNHIITLEINISLPLIDHFTNLRELKLYDHETFENLRHLTLPQLRTIEVEQVCRNHDHVTKFLERNGRNLEEILLHCGGDDSLNLAMVNLCPNLKSLSTLFETGEAETLEAILNGCRQLETIGGSLFKWNQTTGSCRKTFT